MNREQAPFRGGFWLAVGMYDSNFSEADVKPADVVWLNVMYEEWRALSENMKQEKDDKENGKNDSSNINDGADNARKRE